MPRKATPSAPDLFSELEPPPSPVPSAPAPNLAEPVAPSAADFAHRKLAEIAIDGPLRGTFTYLAEHLWNQLVPGARVLVPFGPRTMQGFFIGEKTIDEALKEGVPLAKLKPLGRVLDTKDETETQRALITPTLLDLAQWIARHYASPLGATLSAMLPGGVKRGASGQRIRIVTALLSPDELLKKADELSKKKPKQSAVLIALAAQSEPIAAVDLLQQAEAPDGALKALAKAKLLSITEERPREEDEATKRAGDGHAQDLELTREQQHALDAIIKGLPHLDKNAHPSSATVPQSSIVNPQSSFLLEGVTGSGKTEVYLRALKEVLARGMQGIVLVPEIALTPQTAQRFERRLGRERVAVLHSHITDGDRAEAWRDIRSGKIDVVIGARSALFAPLERLGIIVIDEEHENAFKQESTPRYHARDTALKLAELTGAALVLGSATPSLETLYLARLGRVRHLHLTERPGAKPLPPVQVIDMNRENREQQRYAYLSRALTTALDETLQRGEQTILFMNRRGFATVITCLRCGHTEKCADCDITLTSHRGTHSLVCHYCNISKPVPEVCGACHAPHLKHWGMGTERVEEEVKKQFPMARVARMDSDTMTRRTAYLEALGNFRAGKTDVLVGTQMIAKGLDFPNVTLVGVVNADTALHMPDFRSRERTFQLLAQVAGRAGRGEKGGRVIIQTHLPNDPAVRAAARHDFETFAREELQERRNFNYPPYSRLARVLVKGKVPVAANEASIVAADALKREAEILNKADTKSEPGRAPRVMILGPSEATISKLEGFYRFHILIKARDTKALDELLNSPAIAAIDKLRGADATIDVDALSML